MFSTVITQSLTMKNGIGVYLCQYQIIIHSPLPLSVLYFELCTLYGFVLLHIFARNNWVSCIMYLERSTCIVLYYCACLALGISQTMVNSELCTTLYGSVLLHISASYNNVSLPGMAASLPLIIV